jgi:hypothetical protein
VIYIYDFFKKNNKKFDVISAYSVIQWIMIHKGDEYGLSLLKNLARNTNQIFILEMGTYEEVHYDKIKSAFHNTMVGKLFKR